MQCFSNPNADVEEPSVWERMFQNTELSGKWGEDVVTIAKTQLGYSESQRNYKVYENGQTRGYTRYGAWYGYPYGDWCAMFCSFCMNYAKVDKDLIPFDCTCSTWTEALRMRGLYRDVYSGYVPSQGDLIFFDFNEDGTSEHIGFVTGVEYSEAGTPKVIHTIEGNYCCFVATQRYDFGDEHIIGFGVMPENPNYEEPSVPAEPEEPEPETDVPAYDTDEIDEPEYVAEADLTDSAEEPEEDIGDADDESDSAEGHEEDTDASADESDSAEGHEEDADTSDGEADSAEDSEEDVDAADVESDDAEDTEDGEESEEADETGDADDADEAEAGDDTDVTEPASAPDSPAFVTLTASVDDSLMLTLSAPSEALPCPAEEITFAAERVYDDFALLVLQSFANPAPAKENEEPAPAEENAEESPEMSSEAFADENSEGFTELDDDVIEEAPAEVPEPESEREPEYYLFSATLTQTHVEYPAETEEPAETASVITIDALSDQDADPVTHAVDGVSSEGSNPELAEYAEPAEPIVTVQQIQPVGYVNLNLSGLKGMYADDDVEFKVFRVDTESGTAQNMFVMLSDDGTLSFDTDNLALYGIAVIPVKEEKVPELQPTDELLYKIAETEGYFIRVEYTAEAEIPEEAELRVEEYRYDSEEYWHYYKESIAALMEQGYTEEAAENKISFVQFFDISFYLNDEEIEPADAVNIIITPKDETNLDANTSGSVIHFAEDGTEFLSPKITHSSVKEAIESITFSQDSFSVTGVILYPDNDTNNDVFVGADYTSIADIAGKQFAIGCITKSNAYPGMMTDRVSNNGRLASEPITNTNNKRTYTGDGSNITIWEIEDAGDGKIRLMSAATGQYLRLVTQNGWGINGTFSMTTRAYATSFQVVNGTDTGAFRLRVDDRHWVNCSGQPAREFICYQDGNDDDLYLFAKQKGPYTVWLDGTDGGLWTYYGSEDKTIEAVKGSDGKYYVQLPSTYKSPTRYQFTLRGWYDVYGHKYYPAGAQAEITEDTVFYADWIAESYNIGTAQGAIQTSNTNNFIHTYVFDYNALFNVMSANLNDSTSSLNPVSHKENWSFQSNGTVEYNNANTLDFVFIDYTGGSRLDGPSGVDSRNQWTRDNQYNISAGIPNSSLLSLLFTPANSYPSDGGTIGVYYVGEGNYLYSYDPETGYYSYDSDVNAASYNQDRQRFYVYDYYERTSDDNDTDFLPLNSKDYLTAGHNSGEDTYNGKPRYQFDASARDPNKQIDTTNYLFGLRSDIEFYLPNTIDPKNPKADYGNRAAVNNEHMRFTFWGDDDVWIYVEDAVGLNTKIIDLGGLHSSMGATIDFSTGVVTFGSEDRGQTVTTANITDYLENPLTEGDCILHIYYLERGSSQSNCIITFNLAPRYELDLKKIDAFTGKGIEGVRFTFYTDQACTQPAAFWSDRESFNRKDPTINSISIDSDGVASCWGLGGGHVYYIKETVVPPGYILTDNVIRLNISNTGDFSTVLSGSDGQYIALPQVDISEEHKEVDVSVANAKEGTTRIKVDKIWDSSVPQDQINPVKVRLIEKSEGTVVGGMAVELNSRNDWTYTWIGIPIPEDGTTLDELYRVEEYPVLAGCYSDYSSITQLSEGIYRCTVTNSTIPVGNQTQVAVHKTWSPATPPENAKIKVRLFSQTGTNEPVDTGNVLTLSASNNWEGTFSGLPIKDSNGTVITYSVKEEPFAGYDDTYSSGGWTPVTIVNDNTNTIFCGGLPVGGVCRFITGSGQNQRALAVNSAGSLELESVDSSSTYQQWSVIKPQGSNAARVDLYNVGAEKYLNAGYYPQGFSAGDLTDSICINPAPNTTGTYCYLSCWSNFYLSMGSSYNSSQNQNNATFFRVEKLDRNSITVTNTKYPVVNIEVDKIWGDGRGGHIYDKVKVHLLADGVDTERFVELSEDNNWHGEFENLRKYQLNQTNNANVLIEYSLREDAKPGYTPHIVQKEAPSSADVADAQKDIAYKYEITNVTDIELPNTGGPGTLMYTFSGLMLIAAAGVIYRLSRKRVHERRTGSQLFSNPVSRRFPGSSGK